MVLATTAWATMFDATLRIGVGSDPSVGVRSPGSDGRWIGVVFPGAKDTRTGEPGIGVAGTGVSTGEIRGRWAIGESSGDSSRRGRRTTDIWWCGPSTSTHALLSFSRDLE